MENYVEVDTALNWRGLIKVLAVREAQSEMGERIPTCLQGASGKTQAATGFQLAALDLSLGRPGRLNQRRDLHAQEVPVGLTDGGILLR